MTGLGRAAELVLRLGLVAVFLLAAAGKAVSTAAVGEMVRGLLPRLSRSAGRAMAVLVIAAEAGIALALARSGRAASPVAAAGLVACAVFAGASVLALRRGGSISCRCFGGLGDGSVLGARTLVRAGVLAVAVLGWYAAVRAAGPAVAAAGPRTALCFAVAAAAAAGLAWRRLLPGLANRRFAAYGLEQQRAGSMVLTAPAPPVEIEFGVSEEGRGVR
ncbi:MAG TPA: MauE/DoxX family redox-associated membrane protein [Mycobacteriales bacterium]|nr:MauE/DoxX family redox-associated membrane protein [Mycobacteriales bacterium]